MLIEIDFTIRKLINDVIYQVTILLQLSSYHPVILGVNNKKIKFFWMKALLYIYAISYALPSCGANGSGYKSVVKEILYFTNGHYKFQLTEKYWTRQTETKLRIVFECVCCRSILFLICVSCAWTNCDVAKSINNCKFPFMDMAPMSWKVGFKFKMCLKNSCWLKKIPYPKDEAVNYSVK